MTIADGVFYGFSGLAVLAGIMVVSARNPVHSVLWLIVSFLSAAGLFILLGAEFIAMLLIIVYLGAVIVLFLFVVMMLDIDFTPLKEGFVRYAPWAILIGGILIVQIVLVVDDWTFTNGFAENRQSITPVGIENTKALGHLIYDDYILPFQLAGLILLVAMIGAIVLTLRPRSGIKRQNVVAQINRDPRNVITLVDVPSGQGLPEEDTPTNTDPNP